MVSCSLLIMLVVTRMVPLTLDWCWVPDKRCQLRVEEEFSEEIHVTLMLTDITSWLAVKFKWTSGRMSISVREKTSIIIKCKPVHVYIIIIVSVTRTIIGWIQYMQQIYSPFLTLTLDQSSNIYINCKLKHACWSHDLKPKIYEFVIINNKHTKYEAT